LGSQEANVGGRRKSGEQKEVVVVVVVCVCLAHLVVREELFVRADSSQSLFLKVIL